MSVLPVAFSLMVTFMSAITLLGNPAEIYLYNTMFWWLCIAFFIAMIFSAVVFIPFFYNLGVMSTFEVGSCQLSCCLVKGREWNSICIFPTQQHVQIDTLPWHWIV